MASKIEVKELLDAGVHFGHLTRRWDPNMAPYIYMERNGIHIINLYKTAAKMEETGEALKKIAASGRKILFVATKKQAKEIVAEKVKPTKMPYITERWPGGMLTNFITIRKAVKKMQTVDRMKQDGRFDTLSKKEQLQMNRMRDKLEKNLGSIEDMTRLPGALFVVDIKREHIAIKEAQKLNIPIFAMVDTNSDPREVDFLIPANDDASKSIEKIMGYVTECVIEGLEERKSGKDEDEDDDKKEAKPRVKRAKPSAKKAEKPEKPEVKKESDPVQQGSPEPVEEAVDERKKAKAEKAKEQPSVVAKEEANRTPDEVLETKKAKADEEE